MREVELQDVVEIIAGQSPKSKYYNENGEGVPFFQGKADFGDDYPTVTTWCTKPKKMAQKGDILFSVRAPVGPTNIANVDCCIGRGLSAIRPSEKIDRSFLRFYFKKVEQKISDRGRGSTFNAITQKDLKSLKIPLPSLSEQKAIVAKLDRAQRLIDIDKEMLAKYDELIQSVFLEMFGDPVTNPKGWETTKLDDLIIDSRNGLYVKKDNYSEEEGVKMIHMSDAFYGYAKIDESKRVLISEDEIEKFGVNPEDLLIARRSLNIEGAAKPCMIPNISEDLVFESSLIKVTPDPERLLPIYLHHFLSNERARKKYLNKYITVSTISGINQTNLKKVEILVPPLEEQTKFKSTVRRIEKEKDDLTNYTKKSEVLFSSLVQEAFQMRE